MGPQTKHLFHPEGVAFHQLALTLITLAETWLLLSAPQSVERRSCTRSRYGFIMGSLEWRELNKITNMM
jgi:hypothetical protein